MAVAQWRPLDLFHDKPDVKVALIQLNTPLPSNPEKFKKLWAKALYRAVVDGAANALFDADLPQTEYTPDVITGDFDSARPEVLEFYKTRGCEIISTPDQDFTDFTKCLQHVVQHSEQEKLNISCIAAYVSIQGRFDHVLGNIETLFTARNLYDVSLYLISGDTITWLLPPGKNEINVESKHRGHACGLLPIGGPCDHVTTSGLKWNLSDHRLEFGHLVSTSNTFDGSPVVTIETDKPLVWTMELC